MRNSLFAGLLIVSGAILIAATEIANGGAAGCIGLALMCWGILERIIPEIIETQKTKIICISVHII